LDKEEKRKLERELDEKVVLRGGGSVANKFWIAFLKGVKDGKVELEGKDLPGGKETFEPLLGSWSVYSLKKELKERLECGCYYQNGNEIVDATTVPHFGTIYDGDVVLNLGEALEGE